MKRETDNKISLNSLDKKISRVEVVIDNLAIAVARGFADADQKLEKFKTETEENFKKVWSKFDEVDMKFENIEDNFKKVRNDILEIGDKFVPWHNFDTMNHRVENLEQRAKGKNS